MISLRNEENQSYCKQKVCCIFKKEFNANDDDKKILQSSRPL